MSNNALQRLLMKVPPLILAIVACACAPMVEFIDMETQLNTYVGKRLELPQRSAVFTHREVDSERYELLSRRPDQCNYILVVRKADDHVLSWRFVNTPTPQGCKFQNVRQLM
jgi:hypothetical protein